MVTFTAIIKYKFNITSMNNILSRIPHSIYIIFIIPDFLNIAHFVNAM